MGVVDWLERLRKPHEEAPPSTHEAFCMQGVPLRHLPLAREYYALSTAPASTGGEVTDGGVASHLYDLRCSISVFKLTVTPQSWGEEILVGHGPTYTGKVLRRYAGDVWKRGGLQWHARKDETFYLHEGEVTVYFVNPDGMLCRVHMMPGMSFRVPSGAVHSVQTITDSVMFEASNPVFDDRVNVEADYDITTSVEVDPLTLEPVACFK